MPQGSGAVRPTNGLYFYLTLESHQTLMDLEFSEQIFVDHSNVKFRENRSSGSEVVPRGWTDRHDEANGSFWQLCERVQIPNN